MSESLPRISVLIPCRNEERTIEQVLEALRRQSFPAGRMEVIVADGRSTDGTREKIEAYAGANPGWALRWVDNPGRSAPAGLNAALREARGEILLRMDAHAIPDPDYVEQCVKTFERSGCDGVGGAIDILPGGGGTVARAIAVAVANPFATGGVRYRSGGAEGEVDTVPFAAFHREVFNRVGGFNEQVPVNEDYEFNYRVRAAGGRIFFTPKIRSRYIARGDLGSLARQYFYYGHQKAVMLSFHPKSIRLRQWIPALFAPSLVVLGAGAFLLPPLAIMLGLELIVYAAVCAAFAGREAVARKDAALLPALMLVFFCIHITWGAGFWTGAARSLGRLARGRPAA
ncbi:MAG: glycosyltransferase family 2 protein [Anaerolineales bacterium]|nr:glycosyltransferase family 2 protein [Anaerolineales bacterium]